MSSILDFLVNEFQTGTSLVTGLVKVGQSVPTAMDTVSKVLATGVNDFIQLIQNIPNIVSQLPLAVVGLGHQLAVGTYSAFKEIGDALFSTAERIGSYLKKIADQFLITLTQYIVSFQQVFTTILNTLTGNIVPFIQDIINFFKSVYNALVQVYNEIRPFLTGVINFFSSLPAQLYNLASNTVTLVQQDMQDLVNIPIEVMKQEATRFGNAMPRILGYNVANQVIYRMMDGLWRSRTSLKGKVAGTIATPFLAGLLGLFTEEMFKAFYPDLQTQGVQKYRPNKTIQSLTPPQLPSITQSDIQPLTPSSYTTTPASPTPPSASLVSSTIYPFKVADAMSIGLGLTATEGGVQLSKGYTNLYSQILAETDSAVFHAIIYSELAPLQPNTLIESITPVISLESLLKILQQQENIQLQLYGSVEQAVLPPGVTLCVPQSVTSGSVSGETVTENISVQYASCLPPEGLEFDEINIVSFLGFPPYNQTDEISTNAYLGLPSPNQTDEIAVSYSVRT